MWATQEARRHRPSVAPARPVRYFLKSVQRIVSRDHLFTTRAPYPATLLTECVLTIFDPHRADI